MSIPKETSAPVAKSASAKKMLMGDLMQTVGILPILILIVAVFGFIAPNFFTESNLLNITRQKHSQYLEKCLCKLSDCLRHHLRTDLRRH